MYLLIYVTLNPVHFQHLSAMHLTVCQMSPSKFLWNGSYGWKTYLVDFIRYLVYKFLRPAATFNLTPYSMLCNLIFLSGVIYTSLPIFTNHRIPRVNTALLAHNLRDGTWQGLLPNWGVRKSIYKECQKYQREGGCGADNGLGFMVLDYIFSWRILWKNISRCCHNMRQRSGKKRQE